MNEKKKAKQEKELRGFVRLRAPKGVSSFSHDGEDYEIADDGTIEIQRRYAAEAIAHGFTAAAAAPAEAPPPPSGKK